MLLYFQQEKKIDDENNRIVKTEEGEKLAKDFNLYFYETSAKTGINVEAIFKDLVQIIDEVSAHNNSLKGGKLTWVGKSG